MVCSRWLAHPRGVHRNGLEERAQVVPVHIKRVLTSRPLLGARQRSRGHVDHTICAVVVVAVVVVVVVVVCVLFGSCVVVVVVVVVVV